MKGQNQGKTSEFTNFRLVKTKLNQNGRPGSTQEGDSTIDGLHWISERSQPAWPDPLGEHKPLGGVWRHLENEGALASPAECD